MTDSPREIRRRPWLLALPIALLISSALVYQASRAAFTDTTHTGGNAWSAGTVVIDDSSNGSAIFTATQLKPGSNADYCILVTYTGSLPADVRLYASVSGALAQYLDLVIDEGTGTSASDCSTFVQVSTLSTGGSLNAFGAAHHDFATGVSTWAATTNDTMAYKVHYNLQDNNLAQGQTASATFTWEAQNS